MAWGAQSGLRHQGLGQDIRSFKDAIGLFEPIAFEPREVVAFAYFDPQWTLLGVRYQPSTAIDMVPLHVREVARDALAFDARLVLMAHNHPSGDARPSVDDLKATRAMARMLESIDITLVDHLILARGASTSLRAAGLL
jgi:DNA repair protein RadC